MVAVQLSIDSWASFRKLEIKSVIKTKHSTGQHKQDINQSRGTLPQTGEVRRCMKEWGAWLLPRPPSASGSTFFVGNRPVKVCKKLALSVCEDMRLPQRSMAYGWDEWNGDSKVSEEATGVWELSAAQRQRHVLGRTHTRHTCIKPVVICCTYSSYMETSNTLDTGQDHKIFVFAPILQNTNGSHTNNNNCKYIHIWKSQEVNFRFKIWGSLYKQRSRYSLSYLYFFFLDFQINMFNVSGPILQYNSLVTEQKPHQVSEQRTNLLKFWFWWIVTLQPLTWEQYEEIVFKQ